MNGPNYNYIFFNVGSSFRDHIKSSLHPHCKPTCRGHPDHPEHVDWVTPTSEDWKVIRETFLSRYRNNPSALAAIPDPRDEEDEDEDEEEDKDEGWGDSEDEEDKDKGLDDDEEGGGYQNPDEREEGGRGEEGLGLDDEEGGGEVSDQDAGGASFVGNIISSSPESPPSHLGVFHTPWIDPDHFSEYPSYYQEPMTVMFVDNPVRHTTKSSALHGDCWMCTDYPMSETWQTYFIKHFPKSAFKQPGPKRRFSVWEWVSHAVFIVKTNWKLSIVRSLPCVK
jgi:hypothetical protein